jgi:hypothetical protein
VFTPNESSPIKSARRVCASPTWVSVLFEQRASKEPSSDGEHACFARLCGEGGGVVIRDGTCGCTRLILRDQNSQLVAEEIRKQNTNYTRAISPEELAIFFIYLYAVHA